MDPSNVETRNKELAMRWLGGVAAVLAMIWIILPNSPSAGTAATQAPNPITHHKRIPVYYWHMWSGEWLPVMNSVVDKFNDSQDKYEVIPLQVPSGPEGDQKFLLATAGGDPPDIMVQWTPAISAWAQAGILQPLDMRMTPSEHHYFVDDTYPAIHDSGWYKGHLYGMVLAFDVYACYYRPDMWRKAGLNPDKFPTTLEQLCADGNKLNEFDQTGRITRLGFLPATFTNFVPAFGGSFYDDQTGQVETDTPENERALSFIVDAHKQLGFDKVVRFNAGLSSEFGANWPFITGQQAIVLDGEWRVHQMAQFAPGMDYKVAPLPPPAGGLPLSSYSSSNFLTIPAGAKHADGAWAFLKFWSGLDNPAQAAPLKTAFCWLPSSPQMANAPAYKAFLKQNPQFATFIKLASSKNIVNLPPVPYSVFLQDRIAADDDLAERGALSANQALALLAKQVHDEQAQRKELHYDQ